eukprot:c18422_g1_i2.p1 GENE.c18422_g1_i2~~c18422_g1_i2.p1  ORF type:complete len:425 (-),score=81.61 c18422_g1_i2:325-1599(-)
MTSRLFSPAYVLVPTEAEPNTSPVIRPSPRRQCLRVIFLVMVCGLGVCCGGFLAHSLYSSPLTFPWPSLSTQPPTQHSASNDVLYENLVEWLLNNGATIQNVEGRIMFAGGGHGLFAVTDVPQSTRLFSIPSSLWMSEYNARYSPHSTVAPLLRIRRIAQYIEDHSSDGWPLVLMLQTERANSSSFWKPYIDFIPTPASPVSLEWSDEQLREFQSPTLEASIISQRNYIEHAYKELMEGYLFSSHPTIFSKSTHPLKQFIDDAITAWSRTYSMDYRDPGMIDSEGKKQNALVPFGDLVNHKSGLSAQWHEGLENGERKFLFHAPKNLTANEQVVFSYSDTRTAVSWVTWAGFIPDDLYGDFITFGYERNAIKKFQKSLPKNPHVSIDKLVNSYVGSNGRPYERFLRAYRDLFASTCNITDKPTK